MQAPVLVMSMSKYNSCLHSSFESSYFYLYDTNKFLADTQSGDRQTGRKAQLSNITAAKT
jgi:hypothetical protein